MKATTAPKGGLYGVLEGLPEGLAPCNYTRELCERYEDLLLDIGRLKQERNAVVLAHSYVAPEIIYGAADFVGDSYGLSLDAKKTNADVIVFAAVKFMAETAKLLNPSKTVLVPSRFNGCSLADSITAEEVADLRARHPEHTFMCYINTTADVKALCDITVTSSNVYQIVERIPSDKILFLPDELMGKNLAAEMKRRGVGKEILFTKGRCYVHETYTKKGLESVRKTYKRVRLVAHPECSPEVVEASDFVGSTSQMMDYVSKSSEQKFFILSECGLTSRLAVEHPDKSFVGTCTMCKYMKSNTLEGILRVLKEPSKEDAIHIEPEVQRAALRTLEEMFRYTA